MTMTTTRCLPLMALLLLAGSLVPSTAAFSATPVLSPPRGRQPQSSTSAAQYASGCRHHGGDAPLRTTTQLASTAPFLSLERTERREVASFEDWAYGYGAQPLNGFCLASTVVDGNDDEWYATTSTGGTTGNYVLSIPANLILSANLVAEEYQGYVDASLRVLEDNQLGHLGPQFHLFLKLLMEYEQGEDSPYYPWMASWPRKWNTAASMDDFCLSCLPPFIKSLCEQEQRQLAVFRRALQVFDYVSPATKGYDALAQFAYNVVNTRAFPTGLGPEDVQLIPLVDMINHGDPPNVALTFDDDDQTCHVVLIDDVAPGMPLTLSYGQPTNPSRFLATYGFLNEPVATYCKLIIPNPSWELREIGYDDTQMLFYTADGSIAPAVWDVVLYHRLERQSVQADGDAEMDRQTFLQAHLDGDEATKQEIHGTYFEGTRRALVRHCDGILAELADLKIKTNSYDSSRHPRLPVIRKHNDLVTATFQKTRAYLEQLA